jgi:hypothetical protein
MTIDNELKALLLMSSLPLSWETFVTTVCNTSATAVKYCETKSSILSKDDRRKTFVQNSASEAYTVQSTGDRTSWKKFLVRAECDEKPKQVQGFTDMQIL